MKKPTYFIVNSHEFLLWAVEGMESENTEFAIDFANDLVNCDPEKCKTRAGKILVERTIERINRPRKQWDAKRTNKDRRTRFSPEYKVWRSDVYERDNYTCQECSLVGGRLNAHHIKSYKDFPALRTVLDNGVTLCEKCHKAIHKGMRK